jgi:hypothetical protein
MDLMTFTSVFDTEEKCFGAALAGLARPALPWKALVA